MSFSKFQADGGESGSSFEEHIRPADQYLDHEDSPTLLRRRLDRHVREKGFDSLTESQQHYYVLNLLLDSLFDCSMETHVRDWRIRVAVSLALSAFGYDELKEEYMYLCDQLWFWRQVRISGAGKPDILTCYKEWQNHSNSDT